MRALFALSRLVIHIVELFYTQPARGLLLLASSWAKQRLWQLWQWLQRVFVSLCVQMCVCAYPGMGVGGCGRAKQVLVCKRS